MTVDPVTSLLIIKNELANCDREAIKYGWKFSEINEKDQTFVVDMKSPVDSERYIIEIKFDNYKEWPLFIEFIDPHNGQKGTKNAYPTNEGKLDSFFHSHPCICNPCNRKSYKGYSGIHNDWTDLAGWQQRPETNSLKNLRLILLAIYSRIRNPDIYAGRMK